MAKKFMTKEEKQSLVDSYQKKIDEHFLSIVDKVYIVNEGTIFFEGNPKDAINNENIKKFYCSG